MRKSLAILLLGASLALSAPAAAQKMPFNPGGTSTATSTDASGTVATGGAFQSIIAANSSRQGCLVQNPVSATEPLYVFFGATANATTSNSFSLNPGQSISCNVGGLVLTDNIAVTGATTSHAFTAKYQ